MIVVITIVLCNHPAPTPTEFVQHTVVKILNTEYLREKVHVQV